MAEDETIAAREREFERLKRELAAYKVAAGQVGEQLREISRLNREIDRSRREKELLLATTAGPMRLIGRDFRMRWVNAAFEKACGQTAKELEGEFCHRALPNEDCGTERCLLKRTLSGGRTVGEEKVIRIGDRDRFYIVSASPFFNEAGTLDGILEDFLDITDRKAAEDALRRSEELYRTFIDAASDLVYVKDEQFRYLMVNQANLGFFGRSEAEVVGRTDFDLMPPAAAENCCRTDREAVEQDRIVITSEEVAGRIYETRKFPLRLRDGAVGVGAFIRDITERKRAEKERRELERGVQRAQKLESLGVLAGGIAHDFNNILMVMLGNAELALRDLGPLAPARECLEELTAAGLQAADLCRQMLAYTGKSSLTRSPLDLNSLIGEMGNLIRSSISRKAVLTLNLGENLPPIEGDPSQVRQVVMNLLINASEALEERSGYITLSTSLVDCGEEELARSEIGDPPPPGLYIRLEVTDSGKGMDEETRRRIFEPFFSTKFTGRGLGLVSVLGIVRGHNGTLLVESNPGRGSTFRVLLPVCELAHTASGKKVSPPATNWRGKGRVLLAEDEEPVRSVTGQMLRDLGLEVLEASDGLEALELYRKNRAELDLVLLDLTMPGLDGGEVLREIRRIDPEARVVISSGYSEDDLVRRFDRLSPGGILQKPYSLEKLAGLLSRFLPPETGDDRPPGGRSPVAGT